MFQEHTNDKEKTEYNQHQKVAGTRSKQSKP